MNEWSSRPPHLSWINFSIIHRIFKRTSVKGPSEWRLNDYRSQYQEHVFQFETQTNLFQISFSILTNISPEQDLLRSEQLHHRQRRQQPQLQRLVKRVSIIPRSLKNSEGSKKRFYNFVNVNFKRVLWIDFLWKIL